ncbi:MAG: IS66 family insertion sequence element accessory protein TnpA [Kofleriaceae bacterium]
MRSLPDPSDSWSPDDAKRVFDEWRQSGDSLAAFARRHGISSARLYWWRKRLAAESLELTTLSLVPATVTGAAGAAITIRLPNGIGIEATSATPTWIAAVVVELSRSS